MPGVYQNKVGVGPIGQANTFGVEWGQVGLGGQAYAQALFQTWQTSSNSGSYTALTINVSADDLIYDGGSASIVYSTNAGSSWTTMGSLNGTQNTLTKTITGATLSNLWVLACAESSSTNEGSSVSVDVYDIWTAGTCNGTCSTPPAPTPSFSPGAGTYTSVQTVTISDSAIDAAIYYTTNGTAPTTSSTVYSAPIQVSTTETLKAVAIVDGSSLSAVGAAAYTINLPTTATPTFSPAAGTYSTAQTVTISDTTSGATIYYTTNGTTPTTASTVYSSAITVSATETLEAIATHSSDTNSAVGSAAYTIQVSTPTFSPAAGAYGPAQSVTISDTTSGATIYYTTNGTTPTTASSTYSSAITVSATETLEAIAAKTGYSNSAVGSAAYTINGAAATPTFSPAAGTYSSAPSVTISDTTPSATIYYTTNGTTPTTGSTQYTGAITVSATETLEAIAAKAGYTNSAVGSAAYTLQAATPTFSPAAGTYSSAPSVTISDTTPSATIYYTTNGTTPTTGSTQYTGAITVSATETLEAIAAKAGYTNSTVGSAAYAIQAATPTFSSAAGTYPSAQKVTISDTTTSSTIYYTTNGTTPTTSSSQYSSAITVSQNETLEAIATASGYTNSTVASAAYFIQAATPSFNPAAGTYATAQNVTISDATSASTIYYTTDGSIPSASSYVYSSAITVSASETLEAIARANNYAQSTIGSAVYTITNPAISSLSPTSGAVGSSVTITGTNFGSQQGASTVTFNGTAANSITSWSSTSIVAVVPTGSTTGSMVVTVNGLASNGVSFTVVGSIDSGIITTVAGNGSSGCSGTSGLATSTGICLPMSVAIDNAGNFYFVEDHPSYGLIRKVSPTGEMTTVAGNGTGGGWYPYSGWNDPQPALNVPLNPGDLAVDQHGNLYITDGTNGLVREVTVSTGYISTVFTTDPEVTSPGAVAVDAAGDLFIGLACQIKELSAATEQINTIAGTGTCWYSGDGGLAVNAEIGGVESLALDATGNIYFVDGWDVVREVTASTGIINRVAGQYNQAGYTGNGGLATDAELYWPAEITVDAAGDIYIADYVDAVIREVTASNMIITTVAGGGTGCSLQTDSVGDGCQATSAELNYPASLAVDSSGDIYIADIENNRIRFVSQNAITPTITLSCSPASITYGSNSTCSVSISAEATGTVSLTYNGIPWTTLSLLSSAASASWPSTFGGGTFQIAATYNGDTTHYPATASTTLIVIPIAPTITWLNPESISFGTPLSTIQLDASANVPGNYTYTPAAGVILPVGTNVLSVSFAPTSSGYTTATATANLLVTDIPTITSILPNPAAVGATVTIAGNLFGSAQGSSTVVFNGVPATVTSWSNNSLTLNVPTGATTGDVVVTVGGTPSNSFLFMVPASCSQ
jgi:hypothetical protein